MNQQETIELNRKCAEFLGWKKELDALNIGDKKTIFFNTPFYRVFWSEGTSISREGWEQTSLFLPEELQFHSDWNWIMEVVGKIQSLDIVHDNTRSYDSVFKEWQCTFSPSYKTHDFGYIVGRSKTSEKEAVIEAINQFLTWHNANK